MAVTEAVETCALCGDRVGESRADPCSRCQAVVCRACSRSRDLAYASILCARCDRRPRPRGLRRTPLYRSWKRILAG